VAYHAENNESKETDEPQDEATDTRNCTDQVLGLLSPVPIDFELRFKRNRSAIAWWIGSADWSIELYEICVSTWQGERVNY